MSCWVPVIAKMAAFDIFEIKVTGKGSHAAMPHQSIDAVVIACMIVSSLQTIASRVVDTRDPVVVSVTQIHSGDTWNVIPEEAVIRGTVRSFDPDVQDLAEETIKKIAKGVSMAHGAECDIRYERRYPPTINSQAESANTAKVASNLVGAENVRNDMRPCMGSEDFACMIVSSLQTIASRVVDTRDPVVVSVTQIHSGDTWNVIPEEAVIRGTVRSFDPDVQDLAEETIKKIAKGVSMAHGAECDIRYERRYPPTINSQAESANTAKVASNLVGAENVRNDMRPCMGSEDFAYMLQKKPGSYVMLGAGDCKAGLHNPNYDFNDEVLPLGAQYWAELVEDLLQ